MQAEIKMTSATAQTFPVTGALQRKCDCGQHTIAGGECGECGHNAKHGLLRTAINATTGAPFIPALFTREGPAKEPEPDSQNELVAPEFNEMLNTRKRVSSNLQLKIAAGKTGDRFELEADQVAEQVMRKPVNESESRPQQPLRTISQRSDREGGDVPVSPDQEGEIENLTRGGESLPISLRDSFAGHFGYDFSRVRTHTGRRAAQVAAELGSNAFTLGSHIIFGENRYAPNSPEGNRLLAHELTHVVQQAGASPLSNRHAPESFSWRTPSLQVIQRDVASDRKVASAELATASSTAETRQKEPAEKAPSILALTGLKADQGKSISEAVKRLEGMTGVFQGSVQGVEQALKNVNLSIKSLKAAKNGDKKNENLGKAERAIQDAQKLLQDAGKVLALTTLQGRVTADLKRINELAKGNGDFSDAIDELNKTAKALTQATTDAGELPNAITQVLLVLRNFLASNKISGVAPLSADEVKKLKAAVDGFNEHLKLIFPDSEPGLMFRLFTEYAGQLEKQINFRAKIAAVGKEPAGLVPEQGEVTSFFAALKKQTNNEIRQTYGEYAEAYFFHRGVSSREDLDVKSLDPLFARQQSIAGLRPLVCTGYAFLGAHLFAQAGGKLKEFIIGARVSDDDLLNAKEYSDVHALASISREGATFFVSNDTTVNSEDEGIGPNAVEWHNKDNPIFLERGKTIAEAVQNLEARLQRERQKKQKTQKPKGQ